MKPSQRTMQAEDLLLSPFASRSHNTKGRQRQEEECPLRTVFQRDRDRIIHSKAFRRLKQKTQVFLAPTEDHFRTRLTHTLEVSQIARTIARALRFNEDLTEAIALGHDLGHTPFGHAGERALNKLNPKGFKHNLQSVRVVQCLEKDSQGLNLTFEVINGLENHTGDTLPATPEGSIVRFSDRIAYMNHDIEDAISAGILAEANLPKDVVACLGNSKNKRITKLITSLVENTEKNDVKMAADVNEAFLHLRKFMYNTVYVDPAAKAEEVKVEKLITDLYNRFMSQPEKMPRFYYEIKQTESLHQAVTDYISGMTDNFAVKMFDDMFIPKSWGLGIG